MEYSQEVNFRALCKEFHHKPSEELMRLQAIDWTQPWLAGLCGTGARLAQDALACGSVAQALNTLAQTLPDFPVRFVSAQALPEAQAYEAFVYRTRLVPTRDNLHDFFNALVWCRLPRLKLHLNALHMTEIERLGITGQRGALRDAITLLDENGLLFTGPQALWQCLQQRNWRALFIQNRQQWEQLTVIALGHALLEKLVQPRKAITAHALWVDSAPLAAKTLDAHLVKTLCAPYLQSKPFQPLPVMGIPGWCAENMNFHFYTDSHVFRPLARPC